MKFIMLRQKIQISNYLWRNNKVEFTSNSVAKKNIKAKEKIEEPNNIFDFTVALDEDDQSIIMRILQIKEKVEKQNPDANIEIFDRTIVIDYGYKKDLYFIENGMYYLLN